jgi:tRNA-dihydrouridine synthase
MQGMLLKGVGTDFDRRFFEELITAGEMPSIGDEPRKKELLLSESVARKLRLAVGDKGEFHAVREARKQLLSYVRGTSDAANVRRMIATAETVREIEQALRLSLSLET